MRLFRYRLAALLDRARHHEHAHQMELSRREQLLRDAVQRMDRVSTAIEDVAGRLRSIHTGHVDMHRAAELGREIERLRALLDHTLQLQRAMERQVSDERQRLLDAARHRRMFEIHRDTLALSHHRAELAGETKQLDELSTMRFSARATEARRTP